MRRTLTILLSLLGLAAPVRAAEVTLKEGQCWSYISRPGEEHSFLVIQKIETIPGVGEVAHISIFGLKIKNRDAPNGVTDRAGHVPISVSSLRSSLIEEVNRHVPVVDWKEGYDMWSNARGGVFTKPVADCVEFMDEAINHGKKG